MGLRDTYAHAIQTAKGKFHGSADERDGKLHFINVKTKARGATVRSRTHVVIPSVPGQSGQGKQP